VKATPTNLSSVLDSIKTFSGRREDACKYLTHVGHQSVLKWQLIHGVEAEISRQDEVKRKALRIRKSLASLSLLHHVANDEALTWLIACVDEERRLQLRNHEIERDGAAEFLRNEVHRWVGEGEWDVY